MRIALVLPPLTQLNTPYPSISYLAQDLRTQGIACVQRDLGMELVLSLFSRPGLQEIFDVLSGRDELPEQAWRALALQKQHICAIEPIIAFLQGKEAGLAQRILESGFVPSGPRIQGAFLDAFGDMGSHDAARYLATLYLADMADLVTSCIDEGFALARYQAHLATGARSFDPLWKRLSTTTLVDEHLDRLCDSLDADVVGLSVPFPGNFCGALRIGKRLRERGVFVVMGGGYINTELRDVEEERLWQCVDALTYDDGEGPLRALLEHLGGGPDTRHRTRTKEGLLHCDVPRPAFTKAPFYGNLPLHSYLQTIDTLNPAHRLWADGRWNKITLAHGCYWKKCSFCDISLDYIGRYEGADAKSLADHMERLVTETGERGFHFVDEAAPPKILRALAIEILARGLQVSFWGNIRFEKSYDADLCRLLAAAGLIAVTGGLEVANERLLKRIDKGVTVDQVARCAAAFRGAGVMVHAYLMYGFPTQTVQETIDSMELVRQFFEEGLVQSAFWHRFVLTRHSPIYQRPQDYGVQILAPSSKTFAQNDVDHQDPCGGDHDLFDQALPLSLDSWLRGQELEAPVESWFDTPMPCSTVPPLHIRRALDNASESLSETARGASRGRRGRLLWIGGEPIESENSLTLHTCEAEAVIEGSPEELEWICQLLDAAIPGGELITLDEASKSFPADWQEFDERWQIVRELGLLIL